MATSAVDARQRVIMFTQALISDEARGVPVTPALISEKIDRVLQLNPGWGEGLNRDAIVDELIRRNSQWVGAEAILENNVGHVAWLNAARKQDWRYWQRYREWIEPRLSEVAIDALDRTTDQILGLLEDPKREDPWDRRGLVVGHVQSGKTGNYAGLICKAADAGYKIIIVLAGLHNNLRSQTQVRLDEAFLGYETKPNVDDLRPIGVGLIDRDLSIRPNFATNRANGGDFTTAAARNLGISPEQRPWLFVVKKNKSILDRLNRWIRNHVANVEDPETGRKLVTNIPLLVIDDEADHASVDTGEQIYDDEGNPDPEHEPTAINRLIRQILNSFTHSAYVGYTATPFANIFIHEKGETKAEGPDLFPAAFIINLGAPSSYVGPGKVFGLAAAEAGSLPLVEEVRDFTDESGAAGWMPIRHKNGYRPLYEGRPELPPSLRKAIHSFLFACAVRRLRGQGDEHSSMLIHVTRFTSVQAAVTHQVEEYVRLLRQRLTRKIDHEALVDELQRYWLDEFEPRAAAIRRAFPEPLAGSLETWDDVLAELPLAADDIQVRMINGTAKDTLDYTDQSTTGLKVIAIGGDKLSRGLTLEGLCTSYFLRASKMYDTLMQMGRWFGYRPGYLDLCRLYTTSELIEWFGHIADAAEELREEFDLMAASGGTPRDYGLKVQSHSVLMVTSRVKMRSARTLHLSFSGQLLETVSFARDETVLRDNLGAGSRFLAKLSNPEIDPVRERGSSEKWRGYLWSEVPAADVVDFFNSYRTHHTAYRVVSPLIADFIQKMAVAGELTEWTVALIGGGTGASHELAPGISVDMLMRRDNSDERDRYSIGRLLSPRDESIDLDRAAWNAALELTRETWRADPARMQRQEEPDQPNGPAIRHVRGFGAPHVPPAPEKGLLLLYLLDPEKSGLGQGEPPVLAFGVSFPGSHSGTKVPYEVNNVLWEQQYGPAD